MAKRVKETASVDISPPMTEAEFRQAIKETLDEAQKTWRAETQAMIDAAMANALKIGDSIALQCESGTILCAEQGGPTVNEEPFVLTARSVVSVWESWKILAGVK